MPIESIKERQKRVREEAILETAHALLSEQGYAAMTMDHLAVRTGVSKPTLYQHFPSKEVLAVRVVIRAITSAMDTAEAQPQTGSALEKLERTLHHMLLRHYSEGFPHSPELMPHILSTPEFQVQIRRSEALLTRLITEAKAEGSVAATFPTDRLIQVIGGLFGNDEYARLVLTGQCTAEALAETLTTIFFNGIRTRTNETEQVGSRKETE